MNTTQNNSGELISGTVSLGASRSSWWSCDTWSANIWGRAKACHSMSINKNSGVVILVSFFHSVQHTVLNILCPIFLIKFEPMFHMSYVEQINQRQIILKY